MSYLPDIYKHFERAFPTVHVVKLGIAIGALGVRRRDIER